MQFATSKLSILSQKLPTLSEKVPMLSKKGPTLFEKSPYENLYSLNELKRGTRLLYLCISNVINIIPLKKSYL